MNVATMPWRSTYHDGAACTVALVYSSDRLKTLWLNPGASLCLTYSESSLVLAFVLWLGLSCTLFSPCCSLARLFRSPFLSLVHRTDAIHTPVLLLRLSTFSPVHIAKEYCSAFFPPLQGPSFPPALSCSSLLSLLRCANGGFT